MKKNGQLILEDTLRILNENLCFERILKEISEGSDSDISVPVGVVARAFLLAALKERLSRPFFIITSSYDRARRVADDLKAFGIDAEIFPDIETMPYDSLSPGAASVGRRFFILDEMQSGIKKIWVASVQTVLRILPASSEELHKPHKLGVGDSIDLHKFAEELISIGYSRKSLVERQGQFSLRGGIVDVFPSNMHSPVRIEFFGDEVETIRSFNISDQRSIGCVEHVNFYGCRQMNLSEKSISKIIANFSREQSEQLENEIGKLKDLQYFEGIDKLIPFFYGDKTTVMDYLPCDSLIVIDEPEEVSQLADRFYDQQNQYINHLVEHKVIPNPPRPYYVKPGILNKDGFSRLSFVSLGGDKGSLANFDLSLKASPISILTGRIDELPRTLHDFGERNLKVVVSLSNISQLGRIKELLEKEGVCLSESPQSTKDPFKQGTVELVIGRLDKGFESSDLGLAIITSNDIFGKQTTVKKKKSISNRNVISSLSELAIGDYVVHSTHGIALYAGLQQREIAGTIRDYALLEYAGSDRLFVPVDQLDRLTKYIGSSGETPTVSKLGGADWLKAKRKAKVSARKIAYDLLSLYAIRTKLKGFAFSGDTPWQADLEETFAFEETPDQLIAINEVKRDMERTKPMDRLICGDVGYGKTEVAVRAAFKAAMDGKQVMVLVPTTILAQQHGNTFKERLEPFPVKIEMISRFKTPRQQKDIVERFNRGSIDILIGTHRLLAKDVQPFDLGLIIVDEEQRFGVNDKEKLCDFKKSIDVLTLSATPIPRTLQMSVAGIRDMSTIETPPEGRHPIVTHVGRFNEDMIIEAIRREIGRGGQTYYVHNRVETIDNVAVRLEKLIPEARVATAHGQMSEHSLERIMLAFLDKKYDILVCTTIIESGIDIPDVNTLIVDRAERLGLSQLYQLRGRVGRTNRRAYAYFFYSPQQIMTIQAFERLKTINEYTDLGSGIKIALRDLEIRGAGNLLGAEQHGHMSSVGFELYCQLLKEAIDELEGKVQPETFEIRIDLPVDAYIPSTYIEEESLRIEIYKKIALSISDLEIEQIDLELRDRFGTVPDQVERLLDIAKLRQRSRTLGITEISYQKDRVRISPVQLNRQQVFVLSKLHKEVIYRPDRKYLLVAGIGSEIMVAFLNRMFDDIMNAPRPEVTVSQKER